MTTTVSPPQERVEEESEPHPAAPAGPLVRMSPVDAVGFAAPGAPSWPLAGFETEDENGAEPHIWRGID
ncbi:hypothetical protein ACWGJ2_08630 [Streptomyces sp. NPDC054796]